MTITNQRRGAVLLLLWALVRPLSAGADQPAANPGAGQVTMPRMVVQDNAICSFGFSLKILGDAKAKKISRMFVSEVQEGTRADALGLKAGDEIISVNGIKVADLKGWLSRDGDVMQLFVNRKRGESIDLVVSVRVTKDFTFFATPAEATPLEIPRGLP